MGDMSTSDMDTAGRDSHLEFSAVKGFFLQDDPNTNIGLFDAMSQNFGLIDQKYDTDSTLPNNGAGLTQWQRFANKLKVLNDHASVDESYRLLFLGRHGQGYHNIGESYYGTDAWDCYYSMFDADPKSPEVVFDDAHLTKLGIQQAQQISKFWSSLIAQQSIPCPQTYYVSPLTRAIQTANETFEPLASQLEHPYKPIVKELLREGHGIHTCDRRSTRTYLTQTFPTLTFKPEDPFPETDEIYSPTLREPSSAHEARMLSLLSDILTHDESTYVSFTSHSGSIAALLRAIDHRAFALPTGGAIPVVLKVIRSSGPGRPPFDEHDKTGFESKPDCHGDPLKAGKPGYKNIGEYVRHIEGEIAV